METTPDVRPWVVLKFGGTSVATAENWGRICARVRLLLRTNRVWLCHSALSQVTNQLNSAIDEGVTGVAHLTSLRTIQRKHYDLAVATGICAPLGGSGGGGGGGGGDGGGGDGGTDGCVEDAMVAQLVATPATRRVGRLLNDLMRLLEGVRLTEEASPRLRARISSFGELLATRLGAAILRAAPLGSDGDGDGDGSDGNGDGDGDWPGLPHS